ncbi:MAG: response regulator, partial [Dysgonamonadaceae bacterium]|nr:response regulator [Dysgonamonadaceae bacterium]
LELPENRTEWFDGDKMDKIIDNLLSNAVKYTPENGTVAMELTSDEKRWSVKISDSGIGIAKKDLKKLFSRFFRGENAINTKAAGSGLGLILVKRYVDLHQGTIRTVSAENKGTTFYLTFLHGKKQFAPFLENDEPENAQFLESESEPEPEKSTQKIKVLIVEDNDDLRLFLKTTYEPFYQIFTAQNGAEAWENIPKINPDMIVSDMQMPQMDGLQLVQKIKNTFETSHIPVILLTVVNDRASVEKAFELGVDDYIEKPFETKYLQMKMNNIIRNRKILRSKFLGIDKTLEDNTHTNELNRQFIEKASSIIDEHIADSQFSIADFSKEMGLSKSLLYTKFNTITGYTPNDFIKIARMKKAVEYFRQKQYSINEVTYRVGFEDPAYFSNCFKKIYGDSPKTFIEKNL